MTAGIYKKRYNPLEELVVSLVNTALNSLLNLLKNIRGVCILVLATTGLTTKLLVSGIPNSYATVLGTLGVIALTI